MTCVILLQFSKLALKKIMRRKRFDFLEKDVLAVDLSEEQVILTTCMLRVAFIRVHRISKCVRNTYSVCAVFNYL